MCDQDNRDLVEEVLEEMVGNRDIFTAFDITTEAKKRGADERHRGMKSAIHASWAWMQSRGYDRGQVDLNAPNGNPFVYYPSGADLSQYIADNTVGSPKTQASAVTVATGVGAVAVVAAPVVSAVSVDVSNLISLGARSRTTSEDRLNLGRQDLNKIGPFSVGQVVSVSRLIGQLVISKTSSPNDIATYVVDRDMRIRISNWVLGKAINNPGAVVHLQHDKANNRLIVS